MYEIKLKNLREEYNIKQTTIANYIGIHEGRYSQYETELDIFPLKHLNKTCEFFNISIDYILGFNNIRKYANYNYDLNNKIIGLRLKEFRKENKLTQEKLASILNTTKSVISGYEIGRRLIATPFLYDICKKYNISADYLLGRIDSAKYLK